MCQVLLTISGILLLVVLRLACKKLCFSLFFVLHHKLCKAANIFKHDSIHILHFDVMAGTVTFSEFHVRGAVVIVADILSRLFLAAIRGVVPRKADFVSAVLTVDQTAEIGNISTAVTLALRHRLLHFTHLVPKLLRNNRLVRLVRILHNDHIVLIVLDDLMILIADRSCAELNKMSEVGVIVKYLPYRFGTPHMPCTARIWLAELCVVVSNPRGSVRRPH